MVKFPSFEVPLVEVDVLLEPPLELVPEVVEPVPEVVESASEVVELVPEALEPVPDIDAHCLNARVADILYLLLPSQHVIVYALPPISSSLHSSGVFVNDIWPSFLAANVTA